MTSFSPDPFETCFHPHHNEVSLSKRQKELLAFLQQPVFAFKDTATRKSESASVALCR